MVLLLNKKMFQSLHPIFNKNMSISIFQSPSSLSQDKKILNLSFTTKGECSSYETVYFGNIGIPDIGFKRKTFVTLHDAEVEKLIEFILTCKWA
jgi:hypothetical protein